MQNNHALFHAGGRRRSRRRGQRCFFFTEKTPRKSPEITEAPHTRPRTHWKNRAFATSTSPEGKKNKRRFPIPPSRKTRERKHQRAKPRWHYSIPFPPDRISNRYIPSHPLGAVAAAGTGAGGAAELAGIG